MPEGYRNIYKVAREARGLTQEAAAEKLGISDSSIRAYETGQRVPPNEIVDLMVIAYDSQLLGIQHLRASAEMARSIVPDVRDCSVLEASARLINRIYDFADSHSDRRLMRIAEDNVIDESERPEFDAILSDIQEIVEAALAVKCARQGE